MKVLGRQTFLVLMMLYRGWVLVHLWAWFIMPLFDVAALRTIPAVGLIAVTAIFQSPKTSDIVASMDLEKRVDGKILVGVLSYLLPVLYPSLVLLIGWVWHFWV